MATFAAWPAEHPDATLWRCINWQLVSDSVLPYSTLAVDSVTMLETPKDAAKRLAAGAKREGFVPDGFYTYRYPDGAEWYWRLRAKNAAGEKWIRPMRLNGHGYELKEPEFPAAGKPLYNLDLLVKQPGAVVVIVEGEKAADALARFAALTGLNMVVTTSGGAQSAGAADWSPLAGHPSVIWPDNDEPGKAYATDVVARVAPLGCAVSVVDVEKLDLAEKGDAYDWVQLHPEASRESFSALPMLAHIPTAQAVATGSVAHASKMDVATPLPRHSPKADLEGRVGHTAAKLATAIKVSPGPESAGPLLPLIWAADAGPLLDAPYVVKNVIGPGELMVIYGAPKSGKTFFATDMALHVATGVPWFGHRVHPGLVLYVASEMGRRAERRVKAWLDQRLGDAAPPFAIVPKVVNLLKDVDVERLVATIESLVAERGNPSLLVVDTLARSMAGGDENSAQHMGMAIAVADRLRDVFNTATVLVHHAGKDASRGGRGSSALLGAADTYVLVEADQKGGHVATVEWSRDGEAGHRYGFKLPQIELGIDRDGETVTTCIVEPSAEAAAKVAGKGVRRDVALDALREAISEYGDVMPESSTIPRGVRAVSLDRWKARWALRNGYEGSSGNSINVNFWKDKTALLKADKITISAPFVWINA
jgi:KaiC/GvpD/RAD55 family RecA-like ATPase